MTTRACTTYMVHSVKATGLGDGAPEDQRGKHQDQRQAAEGRGEAAFAEGWGPGERALKGYRRGTGSRGWRGVASSCRKATESGRGVVTGTTTGWGSRTVCLWIFCQELLYKRDCTT